MITALVAGGVDSAIGFAGSPNYQDCNVLAILFTLHAMQEGKNIASAVESATLNRYSYDYEKDFGLECETEYIDDNLYQSIVIAGRRDTVLKETAEE